MDEQKRKSGMTGMERTGRGALEGDESPRPVTPGSRPETGSKYEGVESRSKGTAGPTAQLNRRPKGESEESESSFR